MGQIRCEPCIMTSHKCLLIAVAEELIPTCPCLKCLVKVTCTYDDICDRYTKHMDILYYDEKYRAKVEQYEARHNAYN
jgi:hypothetical protein